MSVFFCAKRGILSKKEKSREREYLYKISKNIVNKA